MVNIERGRGFTLIELLVTISVIAIIASMSIFSITYLLTKAKIEKTRLFVNAATQSCESFKQQYKQYPFGSPEEEVVLNAKMTNGGWLELSPIRTDFTGVVQINKQMIEFLALPAEFVASGGVVIDLWGKEIQSQYHWHSKKAVFWSAGPDGVFDTSGGEGQPSYFVCTKSMKLSGNIPGTDDRLNQDIVTDL